MKTVLILLIATIWLFSNLIILLLGYIRTLKKDIEKLIYKNCSLKTENDRFKALSEEESKEKKKAKKDLQNFYSYDGSAQS